MKSSKLKADSSKLDSQRRGLLAKIHIAVKELGLPDVHYKDIKAGRYGVESAADLSNLQLEDLVEYFKSLGWKPHRKSQAYRLRERVEGLALEIQNGANRLPGLVKKICDVDKLEWCHATAKLKRLVAVLEKIKRSES